MDTAQTEKLLTSEEVAQIVGVGTEQVKIWRSNGQGPKYLKLGHRTVRYKRADVEAWLDQNRR